LPEKLLDETYSPPAGGVNVTIGTAVFGSVLE
jgi:hypothetical protein